MKRITGILLAFCLGCLYMTSALAEPKLLVPETYEQTGTLPIYRAIERDFMKSIKPELFNQSGINEAACKEWQIVFMDEAILELAPEAIFYRQYSGTYDVNANDEGTEPFYIPCDALVSEIASLASEEMHDQTRNNRLQEPEKTSLTFISLSQAQQQTEALMAALDVSGYVCDYVLDMSLERITALGNAKNDLIDRGQYGPNMRKYDYSPATEEDEGFYLSYHKPNDREHDGNGEIFCAYAYVTKRGIEIFTLRDMYIVGDVYDTPAALVSPESILEKLPSEVKKSRFPSEVVSVSSIALTYSPMRAANKADGMVLAPIWLVIYKDLDAAEQGFNCWAEFNAVDGKLTSAIFK